MKAAFFVSWDDSPHLTKTQKETMLAAVPPWQRDSRSKGVPQLGAGAIYTVPESEFAVQPFDLPPHWPRCYGLDVGWNRTAVIWAAHDRDTGIVYLNNELYRARTEPNQIAYGIQSMGKWIPGVVDPAARGRGQKDGQALIDIYRDLGLDLEIADNTVTGPESGIYKVWEMLSAGKIKVFKNCTNFFAEYRLYRRNEKGGIVKSNDHLMDAWRYLIMSGLDRAIVEPKARPDGRPWWAVNVSPVWAG